MASYDYRREETNTGRPLGTWLWSGAIKKQSLFRSYHDMKFLENKVNKQFNLQENAFKDLLNSDACNLKERCLCVEINNYII